MDQEFADVMMEMEDFLGLEQCCNECLAKDCTYKCESCFGGLRMSKKCLLESHQLLPLHRIKVRRLFLEIHTLAESMMCQVSNSLFLQPLSLAELKLKIHLNHQGRRCKLCSNDDGPFTCITVMDTSGIHFMNVIYCTCNPNGQGNERWQQLLCHGFYPSTTQRVHTSY